jgi:DNA-binding transcriptional MerR regulator
MKKIGDVAKQLNISVDTLRYYEKIALLKNIQRKNNSVRFYSDEDVTRIRFIRHAQKNGF